jgi:hypothetical protein
MDIATIAATAATALAGFATGYGAHVLRARKIHAGLRNTLAVRDADADRMAQRLIRARDFIAELTPHAVIGRKVTMQRKNALDAANAANARRAAAKAAA